LVLFNPERSQFFYGQDNLLPDTGNSLLEALWFNITVSIILKAGFFKDNYYFI